MSVELTDQQRQALQADRGKPLDMVDPATSRRYVLLAQEEYERVRSLLERTATSETAGVSSGVLRSQQAFWRDLPKLLANGKNLGRTVCYQGDERIGIADRDEPLIRECQRRGIPDSEYDLFTIRPHDVPPWEPEEVEDLGLWHLETPPPA